MPSVEHATSNRNDLRARLRPGATLFLKAIGVIILLAALYWCANTAGITQFSNSETNHNDGLSVILLATTTGLGFLALRERRARRRERLRRARADLELRQALDAVDLANGSRSAFLANVSHELRTPLNAIIGFTDVIHAEAFGKIIPSRYGDYINDIRKSAYLLRSSIDDILDVSKMEVGEYETHSEEFALVSIVDDVRHVMQAEARNRDVRISVDVPHDLAVWADRRAVRRIIDNLLSNAIKFNRTGGLVEIEGNEEGDGNVCLSIRDTGLGIERQQVGRLFEPFAQTAPMSSQAAEGLGLGLTIVKHLVALQGGSVNMSSSVGVGTAVTIRLPHATTIGAQASITADNAPSEATDAAPEHRSTGASAA